MLEIEVEGVDVEGEKFLGGMPLEPIPVGLQAPARIRRQLAAPAAQHVPAGGDFILDIAELKRRRVGDGPRVAASRHTPKKVALQREGVRPQRRPVHPKTAARRVPAVVRTAIRSERVVAREALAINPEERIFAELPAVAEAAKGLLLGAAAAREQTALRVLRRFGDDVDDAVDPVGAPQARAGAADHFDPFNVLQRVIHAVPINARVDRVVQRAPVDLHELLADEPVVEPARTHRPFVGVDPRHIHARHQAEQFWNRRGPRAPDHLGRDDRDGRGRLLHRAVLPRNGGDFDLAQILERQITERVARRARRDGFRRAPRRAGPAPHRRAEQSERRPRTAARPAGRRRASVTGGRGSGSSGRLDWS